MSEPYQPLAGDGNKAPVTISTEVMVVAVIFLFMVVTFVFFIYLYARRNLTSDNLFQSHRSRNHFVFSSELGPVPRSGLDVTVLRALPVTVYKTGDFKEGLECAVCLCEVADNEKVRLLPNCNHGFHLDCIDMWFHSHSTCPLCRSAVASEPAGNQNSGAAVLPPDVTLPQTVSEQTAFPTNVLFWGSQDSVNTRNVELAPVTAGAGSQEAPSSYSSSSSSRVKPEGSLVIEIPRRVVDGFPSPMSPLPSSRHPVEEMKSPVSARFRSLRRLWSQGKRTFASPYSPRDGDIEQGLAGCGCSTGGGSSLTPKTPTS